MKEKETKVQVLDFFAVQDTYGEEVLAKVESRARFVRFGDYEGLRCGRYVVYWTDAPSGCPFQWPEWWFGTLKEAREHFEAERAYEIAHRR